MELREFDQHDHPDSAGHLPQVGCAICGHAVQPVEPSGVHWDELAPELREEAAAAMSRWSHEHADTHSDSERKEHDRALGIEPPA